MKILVLVDELHRAGGLERSLAHKVCAWTDLGYEVEVLTLQDVAPDFHPFPAGIVRGSLGVAYRRDRSLYSPVNLRQAVRHFMLLRKHLRASNPQVVIHSGYGFDFYFLPVLAPRGVLLVKENHSSRYPGEDGSRHLAAKFKEFIRKFFESTYGRAIYLSQEEAAILGLRNSTVIPNSIPALADDWQPPAKKNRVIAAGRICAVKGFDRLVDAWSLVANRLPGWGLDIYGDGKPHDVDALRSLIAERGLQDSVQLHPATTAIQGYIAESRIYAMTSRSECFPMVLLEAMQLGVPVVAFDCPTGPRNIILNGVTGLLVPDGDITRFADAVVELAKDDDGQRQVGESARLESHRYEIAQVMPVWTRLFEGQL